MNHLKGVGVVKFLAFALVLLLSACGGGGGGGSASPVAPSASVSLSSSASEAGRGGEVTLTWSSQNATSCSASGDWSGSKGTSGSEDVSLDSVGSKTYTLNCSGASKSVTVNVVQYYDTSAFIDNDQLFTGYFFHKPASFGGCLVSVEAELGVHDDSSLYFKSFGITEIRRLGYWDNDGEGLKLGENFTNSDLYNYPISMSGHGSTNTITINNVGFDPDSIETWDDFAQLSGDMSLHFDTVEDNDETCWGADIEMTVLALPTNFGSNTNNSYFVGTSYGSDSYSFLYLIDKREADKFADDLPAEADLFGHDWGLVHSFHSYQSTPYIEDVEIMRVSTDIPDYTNVGSDSTLNGGRLGASLYSDGSILDDDAFAVKYLFPEGESSNQRMALKMSISRGCTELYYNCVWSDPEIIFFNPDADMLFGFGLGGYNGAANNTYVVIGSTSDDE